MTTIDEAEAEAGVRFIHIPEWDLTDRLRKTLRDARMTTTQMAEYLGVQRGTINNWTSGKIKPSVATLRAWALATNVPYEWLANGGLQVLQPPRDDGGAARWAPRGSNPEPTD